MSELVERLRAMPSSLIVASEAADRIEALETLLEAPTKEELALYARIEKLEAALREARTSITAIAAECHRAKWEFDLNEDYTPSKTAARAIIQQAFSVLHRIGDIAIKAKAAALDKDEGK